MIYSDGNAACRRINAVQEGGDWKSKGGEKLSDSGEERKFIQTISARSIALRIFFEKKQEKDTSGKEKNISGEIYLNSKMAIEKEKKKTEHRDLFRA